MLTLTGAGYTNATAVVINYILDEDGNPILDEDGNPIIWES